MIAKYKIITHGTFNVVPVAIFIADVIAVDYWNVAVYRQLASEPTRHTTHSLQI